MLMLKKFKQLKRDEVKLISNLPPSPIPQVNLLLIFPYIYLQKFSGLFLIPPRLCQGCDDTFPSSVHCLEMCIILVR